MKLIYAIISILFYSTAMAQVENNIVKNPSFEDQLSCPKKRNTNNQIESLADWKGYMTPDHFSTCSTDNAGVPTNFAGTMMPADGNSYAGIIINYGENSYTEFLEQKLSTSLIKGQWYCCKFYCAKASNGRVATQSPQIMFDRKNKFNGGHTKYPRSFKSEKKFKTLAKNAGTSSSTQIIENSTSWTLMCGTYQAYGDEVSLFIGKHSLIGDPYKSVNDGDISTLNSAYYYIDNISIVPIADPANCDCTSDSLITVPINNTINESEIDLENVDTTPLPDPDEPVVLKNIFFNSDESELLPQSNKALDNLLNLLIENPNIKIQITGHTDNTGLEEHNIELSEKRAAAVMTYLIDKGINPSRITSKGVGSSEPKFSNQTVEERQKNRRVEFKIQAQK